MPQNPEEQAGRAGWQYDAYEYLHPKDAGIPGRPTCLQEGVFTIKSLRDMYQRTRSVRKTAAALGVSPTTVKKYLKGDAAPPGRPIQPLAWKAKCRSQVHDWFILQKNRQLPRTVREISELSGFSTAQINRYLWARKKAMESYLASLPPLNSFIAVLTDLSGTRVPTNLIKAWTYDIDKISGDVTISAVLTMGGMKIIKLPFRQLEAVLLGHNPDIPVIGFVKPKAPPKPEFNPLHLPKY